MWDRDPQKDIFQGNMTTCCIGMNECNGHAMFYYVMNTAFNFITVKDNTTGETIGNALCYIVKNKNGEPYFLIDNIEINNGKKPAPETCKQIRQQMANYAARVAKAMTGRDDIPIFMSGNYNDVPTNDLSSIREEIQVLGECNRGNIYLDLYGGWQDAYSSKACKLLKLIPDEIKPNID